MLHQVGDLFELNVKLRCQKVKEYSRTFTLSLSLSMGLPGLFWTEIYL
jgi:hypothetical protein